MKSRLSEQMMTKGSFVKSSSMQKRDLQFRFVPGITSYLPSGTAEKKPRRNMLSSYEGFSVR